MTASKGSSNADFRISFCPAPETARFFLPCLLGRINQRRQTQDRDTQAQAASDSKSQACERPPFDLQFSAFRTAVATSFDERLRILLPVFAP